MNLQTNLKSILVSAAALCAALPASAQISSAEFSGTVGSLLGGGWGNGASSYIGQSVTVDFSVDSGALTTTSIGNLYSISAPITAASITGGLFSGINLESGGPNTGTFSDNINLSDGTVSAVAVTSAKAPSRHFTGEVFGLSLISDGITTTLDLIRNAFVNGVKDVRDSGTAVLANVSTGPGVQAPEMDPTSALGALTLFIGGLAVIRGRKSGLVKSA